MKLKPTKQAKVWGHEEHYYNELYCVKRLVLKKNYCCSIHRHKEKTETFIVTKGKMNLKYGTNSNKLKNITLKAGDVFHMPRNTWHRFEGITPTTEFIEASTKDHPKDSYRKKGFESKKMI